MKLASESAGSRAPALPQRQYGPALEKHYQFLLWLIPALEKLPRSQKFQLGDRMQAQAMDVLTHLIDATYAKDRSRSLAQANLGLERLRFLLRCDIWRYFPSMDHAVLKSDLRRRLSCERTLGVVDRIIDGSNPQESVNLYYPGDDLFTPYQRTRGLPIGNLTSQLFGNVYLNPLDHFVKERLQAPGYVRYVDDFALFANSQAQLLQWKAQLTDFLAKRRLLLHPRKTRILPCSEPADFLGYCLSASQHAVAQDNLRRFSRRLQSLRDRWRYGRISEQEVREQVQGWIGHAAHAKTWRLRQTMFHGGWFAPAQGSQGAAQSGEQHAM